MRAGGAELVLAPEEVVSVAAERLVAEAKATGIALTGEGGLLTGLVQRVLQAALESEITDHLGYEPHAVEGRGSGNSRNGYYPKTLRTEVGDVAVRVPRDRNGTFEPVTVPVGTRRVAGLDQLVVSLYAKGLTTGDIAGHLRSLSSCLCEKRVSWLMVDGCQVMPSRSGKWISNWLSA